MKRLFNALLTTFITTIFFFSAAFAFATNAVSPAPPTIDANAYLLMDATTGDILAEQNIDEKLPPASLTKMMTLLIVAKTLNNGGIHMNDKVKISKKAWKMGGSKMFIKVDDEVLVSDLIQGIAVDSGNDAAVAIAEFTAGSEESFVSMMNAEAKALGMNDTHFTDVTGLTMPNHYTTARDLATLARHIITQYPEEYKWYSQKWFTYANIKQSNRNRLLWHYKYADGLKTGHTDAAQYCLVASAEKDGMRLISIVLGAPSDSVRTEDSQKLLTFGFRFFKTVKLFDPGKTVTTTRVYYGQRSRVNLTVPETTALTVPQGWQKKINTTITSTKVAKAPVIKGDKLGTVTVTLNGKIVKSVPLVAAKNDPKGSWWIGVTDYVALAWNKWF